jgi:hypothetical protein
LKEFVMRVWLLGAVLLSAAADARAETRADQKVRLLAFHPDAEVAFVEDATDGKTTLLACMTKRMDPPPSVGGSPKELIKNAMSSAPKLAAPLSQSPLGIRVIVDGDNLVAVEEARKITIQEKIGNAKVKTVQWHVGGTVAAITLSTSAVVFASVPELGVGGASGKKRAAAKAKDAAALLKKRDWSGAGTLLDDAIAASPDDAALRYARAATEAQAGVGRTSMVEQLTWLQQKNSPLLKKAQTDSAFDAWTGDAEIRALLGLPDVKTLTITDRLLERSGVWSVQGASCKSAWVTLHFSAKPKALMGTVAIDVVESCKNKRTTSKGKATFAIDGARVTLVSADKKALPQLPTPSTIVLDDSTQQLRVRDSADKDVGPFEPGQARLDDAVL